MASPPLLVGGAQLTVLMGPLTISPVPAELANALVEATVTSAAGQRSGFQLRFALARGGSVERELLGARLLRAADARAARGDVDGSPTVLSDGVIGRVDVGQSDQVGRLDADDQRQRRLPDDGPDRPLRRADAPMPPTPASTSRSPATRCTASSRSRSRACSTRHPTPLERIPHQQGTDYAHLTQLAGEPGTSSTSSRAAPGVNTAYWGPEIRLGVAAAAAPREHGLGLERRAADVQLRRHPQDAVRGLDPPRADQRPDPDPGARRQPAHAAARPAATSRRASSSSSATSGESSHDDGRLGEVAVAEALVRGLARAAQSANVVTAIGSLDARRYGGLLRARQLVAVRGAGIAVRRRVLRPQRHHDAASAAR